MALLKCAECGAIVSSRAAACTKCGAPPAKRKESRLALWLLGAILLVPLFQIGVRVNQEGINQQAAAREAAARPVSAKPARSAAPRPAASSRAANPCSLGQSELDAYAQCAVAVENLAVYGVEWTDGLLDGKFHSARCHDLAALTVLLTGEKAKFQNAAGAWQQMRYTCLWDPRRRVVLDAAATPRGP